MSLLVGFIVFLFVCVLISLKLEESATKKRFLKINDVIKSKRNQKMYLTIFNIEKNIGKTITWDQYFSQKY
jgi:hypothetical protein